MQGMLRLAQQVLDTLILELLCKQLWRLAQPFFFAVVYRAWPRGACVTWCVMGSVLQCIASNQVCHPSTCTWQSRNTFMAQQGTSCFCTLQHHDVSVVYTDFVSLDHSIQVEALECIIDDIHNDMHLITCRDLLVTMA